MNIPTPRDYKEIKRLSLFLDSGAHTLHNMHSWGVRRDKRYDFFDTPEFWEYVDAYAEFVKKRKTRLDYYVNVDVIGNPEASWRVLKYLEEEHGLNPVPVLHHGAPLKWVDRHLEAGYEFLGVGGVARDSNRGAYVEWADEVYRILCPDSNRNLPVVRTHGFAMTSYGEMTRYPWWSIDSASWAKAAAFGSIFVPHKRGGGFTFTEEPYVVCFSHRSPGARVRKKVQGRHYYQLPKPDQVVVLEWLEHLHIPLGIMNGDDIKEEGVLNHYGSRGVANMRFFSEMCASLPAWPWAFTPKRRVKGFST